MTDRSPPSTPRPSVVASPHAARQIVEQQLRLMQQQLAALANARGRGGLAPGMPSAPAPVRPVAASPAAAPVPVQPAAPATAPAALPSVTASTGADGEDERGVREYDVKKAFGAIARIHTNRSNELTPQQRSRLDAFVKRYTTRTRLSKEYTEANRAQLADPRVVTGFKPALKELVYQVVVDRSAGARVWDLDGNEYVDALNGFGSSLFGWQPKFLMDAVQAQLARGHEIGPMHPLAGEVAQLVCELTGLERAAFCNTGSEAVMGCLRIARTVTGRSLVASFNGSYHGIFDEVIVRGTKKLRAVPAAPGIMPSSAENMLVVDYGTDEALQILRSRGSELAAILVEPVQSRRPDFQPREFIQQLRKLADEVGAVLIFDEVITGFRSQSGGAQAFYGVRADLASYGKVVGGGFPIGVIAGQSKFMDALDGGDWRFGDDSVPTVGVTYFAGTFCRHPLALAAAKASLLHLKEAGPQLQEELNARMAGMADTLNAHFSEVGAPIKIKHFASLWKTFVSDEVQHGELLFYHLRDRGVHIMEGFPCFLTTAHTDADVALIVKAYKESVAELQTAGFMPGSSKKAEPAFDPQRPPMPGARLGRDPSGAPAWFVQHPDNPKKWVKHDPR